MSEISFNPLDTSQLDDPYPVMAELREKCPVSSPFPGLFYTARREESVQVFRDYRTFSNNWHGGSMQLMSDGEMSEDEMTIQDMDPPRHGPVRRLLLTALSPAKVAQSEDYIRGVCDGLVEKFASRGNAELVEELAIPVPSMIITHMIGVPESDHGRFRKWTDDIVENANPLNPDANFAERDAATKAFNEYVDLLIQERKNASNRPDDLLTRMIEYVDEEGKQFNEVEIRTQTRFLIMAGNETTSHLIGNLGYQLATNPELMKRLKENRDLIPLAVEESLRHTSPVQIMFRTCRAEGAMAGDVPITNGSLVAMGIASANRDESVYEEAERFNLDRASDTGHLAFGLGTHLCVGAPLARMEAKYAVNALLDQVSEISLAPGFEWERVNFFFMRGPKHLEVVFGNE